MSFSHLDLQHRMLLSLYAGPCTTAACPQLCVGGASNTAAVCLCDEAFTLLPNDAANSCDDSARKLSMQQVYLINNELLNSRMHNDT
jgi:hypothetical protein